MKIEKERFEAWLFSQRDDREWDFNHSGKCMGCCFLQETAKVAHVELTFKYWRTSQIGEKLPDWFTDLTLVEMELQRRGQGDGNEILFTAAEAKAAWRKLFPETESVIISSLILTPNSAH